MTNKVQSLGDRDNCLICGSELLDVVSYGGEYIEITCRVCGDEDIEESKIRYMEKLQTEE